MAESSSSGWSKLAMVCLGVGFPVLIVGLGYPGWVEYTDVGVDYQAGLWQICVNKIKTCTVYSRDTQATWLDSVRGLEVLSAIVYMVTLAVALKHWCCTSEQRQQATLELVLMFLAFLTGILSFTGAMVYRSYINLGLFVTLSISFWMTILSACAAISACIFLALNRRPQRETLVHPAHVRGVQHAQHMQPGGLIVVNQQPSKIGYSHGQVITQALSPAYAPTQGFDQRYQGQAKVSPAYAGGVDNLMHMSLPGQPASGGIGVWPSGNQGVQSSPGHRSFNSQRT